MTKFTSPQSIQEYEETSVDESLRGSAVRFYNSDGELTATGIVMGVSTPRPLADMNEEARAKWREVFGSDDTKGYMKVYYSFPVEYANKVDNWIYNKFLKAMIYRLQLLPFFMGQKLYELLEDYIYNIDAIEFTIVKWNDGFHSRLTANGVEVLNITDARYMHMLYPIPYIDGEGEQQLGQFRKFDFEDPKDFGAMKKQNEALLQRNKILEGENQVLRERLYQIEARHGDVRRKVTTEATREEVRKQKELREIDRNVIGPLESGESELNE